MTVGNSAQILPPDEHEKIWAIQNPPDFPRTVFGVDRAQPGEIIMPEVMARYTQALGRHKEDKLSGGGGQE